DDHSFDAPDAALFGIVAQHAREQRCVEVIGVSEVGNIVRTGLVAHSAEPRGSNVEAVIAIIASDTERTTAQPQLTERDEAHAAAGIAETVHVIVPVPAPAVEF